MLAAASVDSSTCVSVDLRVVTEHIELALAAIKLSDKV